MTLDKLKGPWRVDHNSQRWIVAGPSGSDFPICVMASGVWNEAAQAELNEAARLVEKAWLIPEIDAELREISGYRLVEEIPEEDYVNGDSYFESAYDEIIKRVRALVDKLD